MLPAAVPAGGGSAAVCAENGKLYADDTPVPVLLPGNKKTKTGRLWTYVRDDRNAGSMQPAAVWFAYSPDRKGLTPQSHLVGRMRGVKSTMSMSVRLRGTSAREAGRAASVGTTTKGNPAAKRVGKLAAGKYENAVATLRTGEGVRLCADCEPLHVLCRGG